MIKAIVFDNGGVLHASSKAVQEDLQAELGLTKEQFKFLWREVGDRLGSGAITEAQLWSEMTAKLGIRQVKEAENLLGRAHEANYGRHEDVYDLVHKLRREGFRTAILSNTIEPHARALRRLGSPELFDDIYLSYEVGLRKPHPEIYEYLIRKLKLSPREIVFIDDDPNNVVAARMMGIHGVVFEDAAQLAREIREVVASQLVAV